MKWLIPILALLVGITAGWWSGDLQPMATERIGIQNVQNAVAPRETAGSLAQIMSVLRTAPGLQQLASLFEPLEQLTSAEMGALIEQVERDDRNSSDYRAGWLFKWWLQRDPESASAWMEPRLKLYAQDGPLGAATDAELNMVGAWAKAFPKRALEIVREYPRAAIATNLMYSVVQSRRDTPPSETWAILHGLPEGPARAKEASRFLFGWAKRDAGAAFAAAESLEAGKTRDLALEAVLPQLAASDANLAFAHYERLGLSSPDLVNKMIVDAGSSDPANIAKWLKQLDPGQFAQVATPFLEKWAAKDPAAAFNWAVQHGVRFSLQETYDFETKHHGFRRETVSNLGFRTVNALKAAMTAQPEATLAWLRSLPEPQERERMTERFLPVLKPEDAIRLFNELGPEARTRSIRTIGFSLSGDSKQATAWVATLAPGMEREKALFVLGQHEASWMNPPAGPERDAWLHGRVIGTGFLTRTPEESLNMAMEIRNADTKREVFDRVMESYSSDNARRLQAVTWLEKSNLPEAWKAKWRAK